MEDIDAAMSQGPGMRFAHMGPFQTYHLAAGDGGIAQYLEHLGPSQVRPTRVQLSVCSSVRSLARRVRRQEARWASLGESPVLESGLKEKIVAGVDDMVQGKSIAGASALVRFGARRRLMNGAPRRARGGEGPDPDGDPWRQVAPVKA